jgi:hypothetical protein
MHLVLSYKYPYIYTLAYSLLLYLYILSSIEHTLAHTQLLYSSPSVTYLP